jgi:hypothetical protein
MCLGGGDISCVSILNCVSYMLAASWHVSARSYLSVSVHSSIMSLKTVAMPLGFLCILWPAEVDDR